MIIKNGNGDIENLIRLGGSDPYSASKGSAELLLIHISNLFFLVIQVSNIRVASARAGNVIGGGDWAENRLVPDCIKAWRENLPVKIKSPNSTRPFQHVLEPLSGYISLAEQLSLNESLSGQSFNFGPSSNDNYKVIDVVNELSNKWDDSSWISIDLSSNEFAESKLLKLNCDKALSLINWKPSLDFEKTMGLTADWYYGFYKEKILMLLKQVVDKFKNSFQIEKFNKKMNSIDKSGIIIKKLNKFHLEEGDVLHAMKSNENEFMGFKEAYFSTIKKNKIKAWKRHLKMTMNLIVPTGEVQFNFFNSRKVFN